MSLLPRDELNVVLVGSRKIAELNKRFLNHDGPTDVITFDYTKDPDAYIINESRLVGEIFVCIDMAVSAARDHGQSVSREVVLYIIHGILHLRGFNDGQDDEKQLMRQAETSLISRLNQHFDLDGFFVS